MDNNRKTSIEERKRQRKKYLIKKKKRKNRIRLIALLLVIGLVFLILNKFLSKGKKPAEEDINILEEGKEVFKKEKEPVDKDFQKEKNKDLEKRLDSYLTKNKLDKDELGLVYFNLDSDETFSRNGKREFLAGGTTNIALNFLYYDLAKEGKINLEKTLASQKEDFENAYGPLKESKAGDQFNLQSLLHMSIDKVDTVSRNILVRNIETELGKPFNQLVYKEYGIRIGKENKISAQEGMKMIQYLEKNKNTNILYKMIISDMLDNSYESYGSKYLKEKRICHKIGYVGTYHSDMGIVYSEQPYIYVILTNYNNSEIVSDISSIVNAWHNYYNK